jgi:hypothetical protein
VIPRHPGSDARWRERPGRQCGGSCARGRRAGARSADARRAHGAAGAAIHGIGARIETDALARDLRRRTGRRARAAAARAAPRTGRPTRATVRVVGREVDAEGTAQRSAPSGARYDARPAEAGFSGGARVPARSAVRWIRAELRAPCRRAAVADRQRGGAGRCTGARGTELAWRAHRPTRTAVPRVRPEVGADRRSSGATGRKG